MRRVAPATGRLALGRARRFRLALAARLAALSGRGARGDATRDYVWDSIATPEVASLWPRPRESGYRVGTEAAC